MTAPEDKVIVLWEGPAQMARLVRWRDGLGVARLVCVNGCFDLPGAHHARLLHFARGLGDALLVAVNSDLSITALKGPGRPVVPFTDRAYMLASLACVDMVVGFAKPSPAHLWEALRPFVLCKGETSPPTAEERAAVGQVVVCPRRPGRSTSELLAHLRTLPEPGLRFD